MRHVLALLCVLSATWLVWSGHLEPLLLGLGALSVAFVIVVARRMEVVDHETAPFRLVFRALVYIPYLLEEIVVSSWAVTRIVLHPRLPISPCVVRVQASQDSAFGRVIYANSITLTPGTVTLRLTGQEIEVHALTREAAAGLASGEMDRRVSAAVGSS